MKQVWLVPLDGSVTALRAVDWIIDSADMLKEAPLLHLLNVQPALPKDIGRFIAGDILRDFHHDAGLAALAEAQRLLAAAGRAAESHVLVGEAAPVIVEFAESKGCSQILIGSHGHTALAGTLLGSVAMRVAHLATVPVLLVR